MRLRAVDLGTRRVVEDVIMQDSQYSQLIQAGTDRGVLWLDPTTQEPPA